MFILSQVTAYDEGINQASQRLEIFLSHIPTNVTFITSEPTYKGGSYTV